MRTALQDFDPSASTSGTLNVGSSGYKSNLGMINDSQVDLTLQFADGSTDILKAGGNRIYPLTLPTQTIGWSQRNVLYTAKPPISMVSSVLMDENEDPAIWRMDSVARQVNINNLYGAVNQYAGFFYVTYTTSVPVLGTLVSFSIANPSGKNVYLLGFDFSTDLTPSGVSGYSARFSNINTDSNTAYHTCAASTTQVGQIFKSYPSPGLPVITDGDPLKGSYKWESGSASGSIHFNVYGYFA